MHVRFACAVSPSDLTHRTPSTTVTGKKWRKSLKSTTWRSTLTFTKPLRRLMTANKVCMDVGVGWVWVGKQRPFEPRFYVFLDRTGLWTQILNSTTWCTHQTSRRTIYITFTNILTRTLFLTVEGIQTFVTCLFRTFWLLWNVRAWVLCTWTVIFTRFYAPSLDCEIYLEYKRTT